MGSRSAAVRPFLPILVAAFAGACATTPPEDHAGPAGRQAVAGRSVQGREIETVTFGGGAETVLIIATIHGNEAAGTPLLHELAGRLASDPALATGCTVVLVPVANPDGLAASTRGNARGVDLNRNFPAGNFAGGARHGGSPLSEPESRTLHDLILALGPARVVSLHQPLACVDHDGPAAALAGAMAAVSPLPARRLGSRPGSLGSWVGVTLGIPIITLELHAEDSGRSGPALWDLYGEALLAAIRGAS